MNWKRTMAFSLVLWLTPQLLGLLSGITFPDLMHWYGDSPAEMSDNARTVRRIAIGASFYLIYLVFLRGVPVRVATHVLVTFFAVEAASAIAELTLWSKPLAEAVYLPAAVRHAVVAILAVATVLIARQVRPNSSFKPTSLRDAA